MTLTLHGYRTLRSGKLSLLYGNGEIRQVCLGRVQVLNAIYAAVRDQNWATIPFTVVQETLEENPDGFSIELDLRHSMKEILYLAKISIEASGSRLEVKYEGTAGSAFLRNRIGLCILHPIKECRGEAVLIIHPDGSLSKGRFPELISPDQPFRNISGMEWNPGSGISAALSFKGEIFEMEDQRNWTDASYKTYCTPLELPFPVQVEKGDQVHQSLTLEVEHKSRSDLHSDSIVSVSRIPKKRVLRIQTDKSSLLPGLGIGRTTETMPLTQGEYEMLSALPFDHYRVDLHLNKEGWQAIYHAIANEQDRLGWPLELALHYGIYPDHELKAFLEQYRQQPVHIRQLLVFDQNFLSNTELLRKVAQGIREAIPHATVGGGTDANFTELNRNLPDPEHLDFICYSICPQIHAFDNLSLLENLEAQADSIQSAHSLIGKPVSIGHITLRQRFNAVATDHTESNSATPESDPRQHTSFTAGWTLGSIRNLALAGAASLTYYETAGPRGILSRMDSSARTSPLYHLFREILSNNPMKVIHTTSSHPLEFDALAVKGPKGNKVLIANYTENEIDVEVKGMVEPINSIFQLKDEGWKKLAVPELQKNILSLKPTSIIKICNSQ